MNYDGRHNHTHGAFGLALLVGAIAFAFGVNAARIVVAACLIGAAAAFFGIMVLIVAGVI